MLSLFEILAYYSSTVTPCTAIRTVEHVKAGEFNAFVRVNVEQHAVSVVQRRAMRSLIRRYYDFCRPARAYFDFMAERQDKIVYTDRRSYEREPEPVRKQSARYRRKIPGGAERRTAYHAVGDDVFAELSLVNVYVHTQR